jgi:hypothetical protein
MFKPKVVLKDNYCEPVRKAYVATVDYNTPCSEPTCSPCDDNIYVRGAEGLSAYQIAVKNGFVGTEVQWLATLGSNATQPEIITFTGATGAVVVDYTLNSRRTKYPNPTYEVYATNGNLAISIGGYGVTITRTLGIIDNITFEGLFGDGYILLKA